MLDGKLFIDGVDAYTNYGITLLEGAYAALIALPTFKKVEVTEWAEHDGVEADLSAPKLDTRTLQLPFHITDINGVDNFIDVITDGAYHVYSITELGITKRLRLTTGQSLDALHDRAKIVLTFADDFPVVPEANVTPSTLPVQQPDYEIDRTPFHELGISVLAGTDASIRKAAQVRPSLTVNISSLDGVVYDSGLVKFKSKDITLNLFIHAPTIEQFWARWNALFSILMQSGERRFYFRPLSAEWNCYYKSMAVKRMIVRNSDTWCEFSVTLTCTDYRPHGLWALLNAEEEGRVTVVVGGVEYHITVRARTLSNQ